MKAVTKNTKKINSKRLKESMFVSFKGVNWPLLLLNTVI